MKRMILLLLALCLVLCTACTKQPEVPDVPQTVTEPEAVTETEPVPQPDTPVDEDALPVYIYHSESGTDAAVNATGTVLVLGEAGSLSLIRDSVTEKPVFIQYVLPKENEDDPARCRLYDLTGVSVAEPMGSYVAVSGNLMSCYDMASDSYTVYRISDGGAVVQDVPMVWLLGDVVVTKERQFQAPSTALDAAGKVLWTQEENWFAAGYYRDGEQFYVTVTDPQDRVGLIDAHGQEILPLQYAQIGTVMDGRATVRDEEGWAVIDLASGETLMRWPHLIATLFEDTAVVQSGEEFGRMTLAGFDGELRTELTFQWLDVIDDDFDGIPELLCGNVDYSQETLPDGVTALQQTTVFLRPDGEEVYRAEYTQDVLMPISSKLALRRQKEPAACCLVDLETGVETPLEGRSCIYAEMPWYYTSDPQELDREYFTVSYETAPEQLLTCIMDTSGNIVLDELSACTYLGGGVFQVAQNGLSGLWNTDGNWLYIAQEQTA